MASRWRTVWTIGESDYLIACLGTAGPAMVVPANHGGTIDARRADDGSMVAAPTSCGFPALATWIDGTGVRAAGDGLQPARSGHRDDGGECGTSECRRN